MNRGVACAAARHHGSEYIVVYKAVLEFKGVLQIRTLRYVVAVAGCATSEDLAIF